MTEQQIKDRRESDKQVVRLMVRLYCRGNHAKVGEKLCLECRDLIEYTDARTDRCPNMAVKTFCSKCKTPCYNPQTRARIRKVMRWAGPRMIIYHPVMAVRHFMEMKKG